ncbi:nucleotidyltransferase family protein [Rothia nasimurium]|uniref:nucleotidyltransferase family protein n=1 Tax=Rothia nasimurium TaxID=85336 RepID=UPI002DD69112|nr:nucleotidyltransferase family protein [Rothia nasimurium]
MTASVSQPQDIPLALRIQLSHAYFQHLALTHHLDILHVKGYAFAQEIYRPGRTSTDVDLLVRPSQVDQLVELALADGWEILAHFETGSIFEHAMTLYHGAWGLVDIHRYFPGLGPADGSAFDTLWKERRTKLIANYPCNLPSLTDSRITVVVHGARSIAERNSDIAYLKETLSPQDWEVMQARVPELQADLAYAAALGKLEEFSHHPDYLLWKSVSEDTPNHLRWRARFKHAQGLGAKVKVALSILLVNKDHLAMELGHAPSKAEVREKFFSRFSQLLTKIGRKSHEY